MPFDNSALDGISPIVGVASGGTDLTLTGQNLDIGAKREILIGSQPCNITSVESQKIVCQTNPAENYEPKSVTLKIDENAFEVEKETFQYFENPTLVEFRIGGLKSDQDGGSGNWIEIGEQATFPTFCSGGSSITIKLNSSPKLLISDFNLLDKN